MYYFPNVPFGFPQMMYPYMNYSLCMPLQLNTFPSQAQLSTKPVKREFSQNQCEVQELKKKQNQQILASDQDQKVNFKDSAKQKKMFQELKYFTIPKCQIGKNTRSNLLRYFLIYLKDSIEATEKVQRIISVHKLQMNKKEFKQMTQKLVKHTRYYFKPKHFGNLCRQVECSKQFSIIFRILLRMFLKFDLPLFIRKSPRLKRKTKLSYLYMSKKLQNDLIKIKKIVKKKKK